MFQSWHNYFPNQSLSLEPFNLQPTGVEENYLPLGWKTTMKYFPNQTGFDLEVLLHFVKIFSQTKRKMQMQMHIFKGKKIHYLQTTNPCDQIKKVNRIHSTLDLLEEQSHKKDVPSKDENQDQGGGSPAGRDALLQGAFRHRDLGDWRQHQGDLGGDDQDWAGEGLSWGLS